jgi:hypothetical protein
VSNERPEDNYSADQLAVLRGRRLADLVNPIERLQFANAAAPKAMPKATEEPTDASYKFSLSYDRMAAAKLSPQTRLELQRVIDSVSEARFERKTNAATKSLTDKEYVAALRKVLPFAEVADAQIIERIIPHWVR